MKKIIFLLVIMLFLASCELPDCDILAGDPSCPAPTIDVDYVETVIAQPTSAPTVYRPPSQKITPPTATPIPFILDFLTPEPLPTAIFISPLPTPTETPEWR